MFFFSKVFVPMMAAAALKPEQEQERKRKRKRKERNQDWSGDLPSDLVAQIMSRFTSSGDGVRFAAVCSSWRLAAASSSSRSSKQHPPWLLLPGPQGSKDEHRSLYSISERKFYRIHLPQIRGQQCVGSGDGWLITLNKRTSQLQLLYFLDGSITPLPSVTTLSGVSDVGEFDPFTKRITGYKCLLFKPPSYTFWYFRILEEMHYLFKKVVFFPHVSLVFAIHNLYPHRLALARLGVDDSWQEFDVDCSCICDVAESLGYNKCSKWIFQSFYDVVYHKGHFYALFGRGWILKLHVDVDKSLLRCTCLAIRPPKQKRHRNRKVSTCYLVESPDGEELMLIWRYFKSRYSRITSYFRVFKCKLTSEEEGEWVRVKCLGEWILFLGENMSSLVLSTKGFPELIPNTIYFTQTQNRVNRICKLRDMGVFHLDSRTIKPVLDDSSLCLMRCMTWSVPIWIPHTECFPSFTPFKKYMAKEIKKRAKEIEKRCAEKIKKMEEEYGRPQQPRKRRSLLKRT